MTQPDPPHAVQHEHDELAEGHDEAGIRGGKAGLHVNLAFNRILSEGKRRTLARRISMVITAVRRRSTICVISLFAVKAGRSNVPRRKRQYVQMDNGKIV